MKIIKVFLLAFLFYSCDKTSKDISTELIQTPLSGDKDSQEVLMPKIYFENDIFDFGEIYQNESVENQFILKNIGDAPLLVRAAKGSCGCTVTEWPKDPINAGSEAVINVTFNSEKKQGFQNKTVTLVTNAIPSTKVLTITGTILVP